ncbi:helix-turn-helix domain-containing protein [Pelagerythrobacter aerophilus]|uniref:Helix-turn-helix domain-containing protein n=1 Tax=Pelagerythrobacter aerophilus TaxID=2306995 RepID=A0A418NEU7_9SPHN|nr:helix-turn-helix domain-containing protein [Pelagerythrobacter aerophilus]RIV76868.1 helix-turn-helix domain-containing protein [Pelagerythrobacter aerophilus]
MSDELNEAPGELPLDGAGQRLRRAREQAGLSLEQVAAETRIPQRHLEVIEQGDFGALPARTYAIGFSRTYARAVGLDEGEIAREVREELGVPSANEVARASSFEPGDPARVPSRGLAWFSAFAALLLIGGGFAYFKDYFFPGAGPGPLTQPQTQGAQGPAQAAAAPTPAAPPTPTGPVVFTALQDDTWVKFYDANGEELMQKQMAEGESYTVPADAEGPQIWTGRPYAFAITIGGRSVPKLSEQDEIIRDVQVSAEALLARGQPAAEGG